MPTAKELIPVEVIENKILLLRGKKVMLDRDLASLYGVLTKNLNKAVRRNIERFPEDFMFQLTAKEAEISRFQNGTLKKGSGSNIKYLPYVFTEQGIAMLSSVLNSPQAIQVNIQIMRTFTRLRKIMLTHKDLQVKLEQILQQQEKQHGKLLEHNQQIAAIFDAIKQLLQNDETFQQRLTYTEDKEQNKLWGFAPRK
ncbi:MAG: ORF6N domain-containing protein [Candidatus Margulisbacteria bacterium]|jgi:phage regulator Rha-like protein|nr:ORF6N domain-containing protein [Candidatus Margulisiibacteriota bacterium]